MTKNFVIRKCPSGVTASQNCKKKFEGFIMILLMENITNI